MPRDLSKLESRIGYSFVNKSLLKEALTHSSVRAEPDKCEESDHERLEFLGDAVVGMVLSEFYLKTTGPDFPPAELNDLKTAAVTEERQYAIAVDIQLMEYVDLGGPLANMGVFKRWGEFLEALVGAIYIDAERGRGNGKGLEMAKEVIYRLWGLELNQQL